MSEATRRQRLVDLCESITDDLNTIKHGVPQMSLQEVEDLITELLRVETTVYVLAEI